MQEKFKFPWLSYAAKAYKDEALFEIFNCNSSNEVCRVSYSEAYSFSKTVAKKILSTSLDNEANNTFLVLQTVSPLVTLVVLGACEYAGIHVILVEKKSARTLNKALQIALVNEDTKLGFLGGSINIVLMLSKTFLFEINNIEKDETNHEEFPNSGEENTLLLNKKITTLLPLEEIEKMTFDHFSKLKLNGSREVDAANKDEYIETSLNNKNAFAGKFDKKSPKLMFFTSGTSSAEAAGKLVVFNYKNMFNAASRQNKAIGFGVENKWALTLPLHHVAGCAIFFRVIHCGGRMVYAVNTMPKIKTSWFVEKHCLQLDNSLLNNFLVRKTNFISIVTPQLQTLHKGILQKFKMVLLGGGSILKNHWEKVKTSQSVDWGFSAISPTYGLSESFAQLATWRPWLKTGSYAVLPGRKVCIKDGKISFKLDDGVFEGYLQGGKIISPLVEQRKNSKREIKRNYETASIGSYEDNKLQGKDFFETEDVGKLRSLGLLEILKLAKYSCQWVIGKCVFSKKKLPNPFISKVLEVQGRGNSWVVSGGENLYLPQIEADFFKIGMARLVWLYTETDMKWGHRIECFLIPTKIWQQKLKKIAGKNRVEESSNFAVYNSYVGKVVIPFEWADADKVTKYLSRVKEQFLTEYRAFAWPKVVVFGDDYLLKDFEKKFTTALQNKPARRAIANYLKSLS